ncbi:dTDP-4-dehydrorhamnose reductase [Eubacterium aggregans]|uniref:dTDP-4-dehydrorhamnose reductase n=1 Tax=Eubacterium aggregans TaxID=81409 RepID=A0A1H4D3M8_9FIRM|nr:dTDP-4-dehydrorhamnose reductase [Eubacterium aggregans]SEA67059.1 dTDP-4-dehydrorhamnose reductase [Eubacterium aggregans]
MKVFITGSNGQLGRELSRQLQAKCIDYSGYDIPELDITDKVQTAALIQKEAPDIIINCGAMTNVDGCESNSIGAERVNADGPKNLAEIARDLDLVLVQVSTDYVFDGEGISVNGEKRPYVETDAIDPQTVYGVSKAHGEAYVSEIAPKHFIVRTAWLYGDGNNFVKTMLRLAESHDQITVVADQIGSPTSTVDLATAILNLIETKAYGTYHATCEGQCSWYDFAKKIFELCNIGIQVDPVSSEEYISPTPRPKYSVLKNKGLSDLGINTFRPWEDALVEYLDWLKGKQI